MIAPADVIHRDPEILGGTPGLVGTRRRGSTARLAPTSIRSRHRRAYQ